MDNVVMGGQTMMADTKKPTSGKLSYSEKLSYGFGDCAAVTHDS